MTRLYLAVFLPLFPSERLVRTCIRTQGQAPETPFALVDKQKGAMRLVACDPAALAVGLTPGLALADARARVPDLTAFDYDPQADQRLLLWLADVCELYTPGYAVDPPQGLILDVTGCTHRLGDEKALAKDLQRRLRRHGFTARTALGATPDSARAKAMFAVDTIGDLPVEALDMSAKTHQALRRAGLRSIADLACRPRRPLAARFGKACTLKLARLLEEEDPHIIPRRVTPIIHVERNFAEPVARTNDVLLVIEQLAGEAAVVLGERGKGGRRFEVTLFRSDGHVVRLVVDTGTPTRDPALLNRLIRERIDTLADPLDPGFGYDLLRLAVPVAETLANTQMGLESKVDVQAEGAALIDRLSVRLGPDRVRRFHAGNSHMPERAAQERAAASGPPTGTWPKADPGEPPARPFRLFDPPQPIDVIAEIPDGPPRQFRWRRKLHQVTLYEGPERIAAEWWRRKGGHEPGAGGLTRDYYRVEDNEGQRFWVFRHGLYGREKNDPKWYLHGLFA